MIELSIGVQFFYASDQFGTSPKLRISLVFSQIILKFVYIYIYMTLTASLAYLTWYDLPSPIF